MLLWIDENHDGISQPSELHTLPELGVYSISLRHRDDRHFFDGYGNWFHYQAALNPDPRDGESKDGRLAYDVFFMTAGEHNQSVRPSATPKSLSEPRLAADLRSDALASSSNKAGTAQTVPYRYSLIVGKDRAPKVQVWNDYGAPITGIAVTVDLSDNIHQVESRTYYDTHVNLGLDFPIYQHESRLISIGYAPSSDVTKLTPRIRAVAFSDGTTVGERVWTDALMARRKHLYASLISLRGLLAEQTAGTPLKEVVEKLTGARKEMYSSIPKNEFRRVDDLVFDSAIRALNHARGDSTHVLKSYLNHLEAAIEDAAGSHLQTTSEPEIVPPHLDGRLSTRRNQQLFTPAASGAQLGRGLADRSGWLREYDPDRPRLINIASPALPTVTYTCTAITQNNPSDTECANPPANDYPTFTFVLTAEITATNSQTGAKTTTTFSTSGTAGGMCEYYTDCDGDLVNDDFPGYADPSGPDTEDDGTAVGTAFWWVLSNYAPGASGGCDCDDPDPYGTTWNYSFSNALTPTFWVAESGNTSSNCAGLVQELD